MAALVPFQDNEGWFYVTTKNVKPSFAHISLGLYLSIFLQCHITAAFLTVNTNPQFDGYLPLPKAPKGPQQDPKMGRGTSYLNRISGSGLLTTSRKHGTLENFPSQNKSLGWCWEKICYEPQLSLNFQTLQPRIRRDLRAKRCI